MNTLNSSVNTVHVQFSSRSVHLFSDDHLCSHYVHVQFTFSSHPQRRSPRGNASHVHTITNSQEAQTAYSVPHKRISTVTKSYHCKCIATQVTATHPFALSTHGSNTGAAALAQGLTMSATSLARLFRKRRQCCRALALEPPFCRRPHQGITPVIWTPPE